MKLEPMSTKYNSYLTDESHIKGECEDILFIESPEEVEEAVRDAVKNNKKITVEGARTGLCGSCVPMGGRVINLSLLNKILDFKENESGAVLCVQAGATLEEINKNAQRKGYFFPVNATEETAAIGGMFSTNAQGPNAAYYHPTSYYVKSVNFTFPSGETYKINRGEYKIENKILPLPNGKKIDFSNLTNTLPFNFYEDEMDLIDFLAGKEGHFGIASEFELSLMKNPKDVWGVVFFFQNEETSFNFIKKLSPYSSDAVRITTGEYYSEGTLNLIKAHLENPLLSKLPELPQNAKTAFYIELESESEEESEEVLMDLLDLFAEIGGNEEDTWAQNGISSIKSFRDMRHAVVSILNEDMSIHSDSLGYRWETDIRADENKFEDYINLYNEVFSKYSLPFGLYGSIINNHLHAAVLAQGDSQKNADKAVWEICKRAAAQGAKIGAKYGVGRAKKEIMESLLDEETKHNLKNIINAVDEFSVMNP